MDLFEKLERKVGHLQKYAASSDGYFMFPKLDGEIGPKMKFNGKEQIVWSINNYLGLANEDHVRKNDTEAAAKYGSAYPMGSRMMSGNTDLHVELENELSDYVQKERTLLFNYGYQGMISLVQSLVDRKDVIVYDYESHACIVDGVSLHPGKRFTYDHNNIDSLKKALERATKIVAETQGGILVVTEGVFGMRGDQGKLKEICDLKKDYQFRLLVDDAHGFGTLGPNGEGAGVEQGVQDQIDLYFSTFAKSFANIGAFVSTSNSVVEYLRYNMRSQIFAKSLPMIYVATNLYRLKLIRSDNSYRKQLWDVVSALQDGLKDLGYNIGNTNSCVTPVYLEGSIEFAQDIVRELRENYGIFCSMVVYPVIPKGMILLRLIPTAAHNIEHVKDTLKAFEGLKSFIANKKEEYAAELA